MFVGLNINAFVNRNSPSNKGNPKIAAAEVGSSAACLRASPKNPPAGGPRGLAKIIELMCES